MSWLWDTLRCLGGIALFILGGVTTMYFSQREQDAYRKGVREGFEKGKNFRT